MTLGKRLNRVLNRMLMYQEGPAVNPAKESVNIGEGGHHFHGERGGRPSGSSRPMVDQWAERFERLIEVAEGEAEAYDRGVAAAKPFRGGVGLKSRIREYAGKDPVYVAFVESCSVELVRKVRRECGLHVSTGAPMERNEKPLSAPPRDTLEAITARAVET